MNTPVLETERLILRPFCRDDVADVLYCWESDPDVAKYMFWTSHNDIEKTKEWIDFELGQIEKHDWYRFAIVLKGTNVLIGTALIYYEDKVDCWEIGYNLGKKYWAKGWYAHRRSELQGNHVGRHGGDRLRYPGRAATQGICNRGGNSYCELGGKTAPCQPH